MFALGNYSWYSFYGSLLSPRGLAERAAACGYAGVGLADVSGFYGAVDFSQACQAVGIKPVFGCRFQVERLGRVQITVRSPEGYRALCRALTRWNMIEAESGARARAGNGKFVAPWEDFWRFWQQHGPDLWLSLPIFQNVPRPGFPYKSWRNRWRQASRLNWPEAVWIELGWSHPEERALQRRVYNELSANWERWVVMAGARSREPGQSRVLDVLQSIGTLTRVNQQHPDKLPSGDYTLPSAELLQWRFRKTPQVLASTEVFAKGCDFDYTRDRLFLPHWSGNSGSSDGDERDNRRLRYLCLRGLVLRYRKENYPWAIRPSREERLARLRRELRIVQETGYAGYFLIFHDVVLACQAREIPMLARGSAAGSLICYCLGVSNVCPFRFGLNFERFLNIERLQHSKLPDIDLDLPWDRRDEIITHLCQKYGSRRVAMIGGFSTFKARAAVAEAAKCHGLPDHAARAWTRYLPHGNLRRFLNRREAYVEAQHLDREEQFAEIAAIAKELSGLPRHPMMHPCGIVIADRPLTDFTPLEISNKGFPMTQMAFEPIEDLGLLKLDLLGQAGLSVLRDTVRNVREDCGVADPLAGVDYNARHIFDMVANGGARGVFHIESPAMTGLLNLCRCADIDCLVATVSVIRPGAANEDKKNKFARRYLGLEMPEYAHPDLEPYLRDTFGLMVYEEHIILVAHHFAGMDLGSADLLRRVLVKKKDGQAMEELGNVFAACARRKGRNEREIETVWRLLADFSGYMFNKAHGAAYAIEAFDGCWLKHRWPIHFLAAVLQNRRGFYRSLVYVLEARRHGARFSLPDVYRPDGGYRVVKKLVGIPLWQINGLSQHFVENWQKAVARRSFTGWEDFLSRVQPDKADLLLLARVGALRRVFSNRHRAVWEAHNYRPDDWSNRDGQLDFSGNDQYSPGEEPPDLPIEDPHLLAEWEADLLGYPVTLSPFAYWLAGVDTRGTTPIDELPRHMGEEVEIAGIVVNTRSHTTSRGEFMKFISLADATGIADMTIFPPAYRKYGFDLVRKPAFRARIKIGHNPTNSGISPDFMALVEESITV